MIFDFRTHEVRELAWIFEGPGLLSTGQNKEIETDEYLRGLIHPYLDQLRSLDCDPAPLKLYLSQQKTFGRLGRYFEGLLRYYLENLANAFEVASNIQIREHRRTHGELDLLFRLKPGDRAHHWEASVKFYLCTTTDPIEATDARFFMGTLVEDRLDRKIDKLLNKQVRLPKVPAAEARLLELGFADPESRALLRGFLYYPSQCDWRHHPHPPSISENHIRGWWTTSGLRLIPQQSVASRYILIPPERWLAPFQGEIEATSLLTHDELLKLVEGYFGGDVTERLLHREMMIAEVQVLHDFTPASEEGKCWVREMSRGNILHAEWPQLARASVESP